MNDALVENLSYCSDTGKDVHFHFSDQTLTIFLDSVRDAVVSGVNKVNFVSLDMVLQDPKEESVIKICFLISKPNHMLWVLKRTISLRRFFLEPKTKCLK